MPCDSVTTQSVNLNMAIADVLADALRADGWRIIIMQTTDSVQAYKSGQSLEWQKGKGLSIRGSEFRNNETISAITQAYSRQAVQWAAKRAGWTVQQTAADQLTVTRR